MEEICRFSVQPRGSGGWGGLRDVFTFSDKQNLVTVGL